MPASSTLNTTGTDWTGLVTTMLGTGAALVLANNSGKQSTALATSQAQAANAQVVAEMQAKNAAAASSTTKYALIGAGLAAVVLIGYLITRKG